MVVLPEGSFRMGGLYDDQRSRHIVQIRYRPAVGKYEVTFAQWYACVRGFGCGGHTPYDMGWGTGCKILAHLTENPTTLDHDSCRT